MESSVRVVVEGVVFDVVARGDRPGQYDYTWISGPNPGYGFGSASSQVDPETGYIE